MTNISRPTAIFVWQSLVVEGYRSFFTHLASTPPFKDSEIILVAPKSFTELGGQKRFCDSFLTPFETTTKIQGHFNSRNAAPKRIAITLTTTVWHIQAVFFHRMTQIFTSLLSQSRNQSKKIRVDAFLICEPYSFTTLFLLIQYGISILLKKISGLNPIRPRIFLYTAQNINKLFPFPLRMIEKISFHICDGILVCGKTQEVTLRERGYQGKVLPFPLWYDSKLFGPHIAPRPTAEGRILFAFAGSFLPEKGIDDFIDALFLVETEYLSRMQVIFAGSGPQKDHVESRIAQLLESRHQQGAKVEYVGALSHTQVAELFAAAACVVVPSRTETHWREQFCRVIVEAQACGARVIASNTGEIPFVVADKSLLFPEKDSFALSRLLEKVVCEELSAIPSEARDRRNKTRLNNERYSDELCAQRFAAIFLQEGQIKRN